MLANFNDCSYPGSPAPHSERHHSADIDMPFGAHLYAALGDDVPSDELEVLSLSLTRHAVHMKLPHDVPVGSVFKIEIGAGGKSVQSLVRITSCSPIADGLYRAGGEFC